LTGPPLEAGKPLADIGEKSRLGHFAVCDDIDPAIDLPANDFRDRTAQPRLIGSLIIEAAAQSSLHHIEQIGPAWQAAHMSRQNPVFAQLQCPLSVRWDRRNCNCTSIVQLMSDPSCVLD